jgi:signal transduction histidine kinase
MVLLIIIPLVLLSFYRKEIIYQELSKQKKQELISLAKYLELELPDSYENILIKENVSNSPDKVKIEVLNNKLQPIIDKFSRSHPHIGMGFYDLSMSNTVAIGPNYSKKFLEPLPDGHPYLNYLKTKQVEVFMQPTSVVWDGKPIMVVINPIFLNGKLIGHSWANAKTEDIILQANTARNRTLFFTLGLFILGIIVIYYFKYKTQKALEMFAKIVVSDSSKYNSSLYSDFPELNLVVQQIAAGKEERNRYDRLNLVGQMAAGISHEIRNPLTTIRGFLQLLGDKEVSANNLTYYKLMIDELDRANSIITEFLTLSKGKADDSKMMQLSNIVHTITPLITADCLRAGIDIEIENSTAPAVLLNENEIRQVILNLVRNAIEAMTPGGKVIISTFKQNDEVILSVSDTGSGINPDILNKIGTPFFTTKEQGNGLGLAACYSIVARNNGKIEIDTNHQGTTFYVKFKKLLTTS